MSRIGCRRTKVSALSTAVTESDDGERVIERKRSPSPKKSSSRRSSAKPSATVISGFEYQCGTQKLTPKFVPRFRNSGTFRRSQDDQGMTSSAGDRNGSAEIPWELLFLENNKLREALARFGSTGLERAAVSASVSSVSIDEEGKGVKEEDKGKVEE
jgi:hypothetical protein